MWFQSMHKDLHFYTESNERRLVLHIIGCLTNKDDNDNEDANTQVHSF